MFNSTSQSAAPSLDRRLLAPIGAPEATHADFSDLSTDLPPFQLTTAPAPPRWSLRSIAIIVLAWLVLQIGGLFTPGLLDDVDSIYIEIAREMLQRHDYVTPYINGVRFFDKPPLMYWMAAGSMHLFGPYDWAARLPLAIAFLALLLAVYALGIRLFRDISPAAHPDRGGFYAALALATSIGPYLYTRFYIPDILLALWMTLAVHLFLIALDRINARINARTNASAYRDNALLPCLAFAAVMALNVLTKGLIGLVFPIGFVVLYLAITRQLRLLPKFHLLASTVLFLAIAAPWHILAALRTPAIALRAGPGLPALGGWAWFYLYNEHIARFLGKRIPHDYGQVPVPLFWLLNALWIMPWAAFLPSAIAEHIRILRNRNALEASTNRMPQSSQSHRDEWESRAQHDPSPYPPGTLSFAYFTKWVTKELPHRQEAALSLLLWAALVLGFFTLSSRQEYYGLPALPALALMAAGLLARADNAPRNKPTLNWSLYFLLPLTTLIAAVCGYFAITAPRPAPGADIASLIAANPEFYNLSLGHLFDLTGAAMGLFRGPLVAVALGMLAMGLGSYLLRRSNHAYAANLALAAAMTVTLLAAHEGLVRFNPILGSKGLSLAIDNAQQATPAPSNLPDKIILDGELTSGSTLIFYTRQQVHLINGNVNGLWYGSFWPDAPHIFESEDGLHQLWSSPRRIFLLTSNPTTRTTDLTPYGPVHPLAAAGGKTILTNR